MNRTLIAVGLLFFAVSPSHTIERSATIHVTEVLKTTTSWDGKPIVYPGGQAEITGMVIEIAPGGQTGWHLHPVPSFGTILEGELEVTLRGGQKNRLKAGDAIAEVIDTDHNGRNVGKTPVKLLVFYAGTAGGTLTVKDATPAR